jgi:hypothetical protein
MLALAQQATARLNFLEIAHARAVWDDNMAVQGAQVNLWKTAKVSYPSTHSNGTQRRTPPSVDSRANSPTNMVLDTPAIPDYC